LLSDSPKCLFKNSKHLFGTIGDSLEFECEVTANPENVTFLWFFNNTEINLTNNKKFHSRSDGLKSLAYYLIEDWNDFGIVSCLAFNRIEAQSDSCLWNISSIQYKAKHFFNDCQMNESVSTVLIKCSTDEEYYGHNYQNDGINECRFFHNKCFLPKIFLKKFLVCFKFYHCYDVQLLINYSTILYCVIVCHYFIVFSVSHKSLPK
jgi:hypothetical protein